MADPAILVRGLTKTYGRVPALRGIDLELRRGEIFGFLGPNGAGKTTTIRCMLDMIRPDSGTIRVLGIDPQADPVAVHTRTGYLPGELNLEDRLTAEQLLRHLAALRGRQLDLNHVLELAERLTLDLKRPIRNLSKGNKQKIGVIQAMMHKPDLLLFDEPTSGLDPLLQREVLSMVREAREQGTTVFFSSHILSEVQEITDRVGIIRQGRLVEVADTANLIKRSLRRVRLRFREAVQVASLTAIPGVSLIAQDHLPVPLAGNLPDGTASQPGPDHLPAALAGNPSAGAAGQPGHDTVTGRADASQSLLLQVEGEMDAFIKALARLPVIEFETERPSLEELFLAYYSA